MRNFYLKHKSLIWGVLSGVIIMYALSAVIVENKLSALKQSFDANIAKEISVLSDLAVTTGKGGFNHEAETMINDCSNEERVKFEALLSTLDSGLAHSDLIILNNLFSSCGHVFANRRTSMQNQMERELAFLESLVEKRQLVDDYDASSIKLSKWQELVDTEKSINADFQGMVVVQKGIIDSLIAGKTTNSAEVQNLQKEAQELKEKLSVATGKSSAIRSELISS